MFNRILSMSLLSSAVMAATLFISSTASEAKDAKADREVTHIGKVVSVTGNQLVMKVRAGKEHTHTLAQNAKVTCDGTACNAADLKPGMKIRVTTMKDDKKVATHVEALDKNEMFSNTHEGKFTSIVDHKLTMTNQKGKEHTHVLADDATMTCDGMACKVEHLKAGMRIRVTTEKDESGKATHIEAINKDAEFSQEN